MNKGWELKTLKDVGYIFSGNSINAKIKEEKYLGLADGLPYVATKDIGYNSVVNYESGIKIPYNEADSFSIARKNSVLICSEGGSAGRKIGRVTNDVCFVNKLFAITPVNETASKYIFYWYKSNSFKKEFDSRLTGLIGGVSKSKFESISIPIPGPEEQKKITAKLDQYFSVIDKAILNIEINIKNTSDLLLSKINTILDIDDSNINPEHVVLDLVDKSRIVTYGVIKLGDETPKGVNCLRTSNVKWLNIDTSKIKKISKKLSDEYSRTILKGGEVLVNVRGTLGGVDVASDNMKGWNISREVALIPVDSEIANPYYVAYWVASDFGQKWLNSVKKGAAYTGINLTDLRILPIFIPSISNQNEIIKKIKLILNQVRNIEFKYKQELSSLEELKKSILEKAFAGEL